MTDLGVEFRAQVPIGPYRVDFLALGPRGHGGLVVECDGRAFHDPNLDRVRDSDLKRLGYEVVRFTGSQIFRDPARCASVVRDRLQTLAPERRATAINEDEGGTRPTPEQEAASRHRSGPARVTAGAGSGKTRVIATRIRQLVAEGVDPASICSISYTNAAVQEMRDRLPELTGEDGVAFTTIHSLAKRITDSAGWSRQLIQGNRANAKLPTRHSLVSEIVPRASWGSMLDGVTLWVEAISFYRQAFEPPDFREWEPEKRPSSGEFIRICERYEDELKRRGLTDFEGMIHDAIRALARDPEIRLREAGKFDHWIVDEYQDLPPAKLNLLRLLTAPARNIFVVGDEDQVIFGFAGSKPSAFGEFGEAYPGFVEYQLGMNFRCPPEVITATNSLIANNLNRTERRIIAAKSPSPASPVQVFTKHEYDEVALQFVRSHIEEGVSADEIALLFRNAAMAIPIERRLDRAGIAYIRLSREKFFERRITRRILAWLRMFASGERDWPALVGETLMWPNRYITKETREACRQALLTDRSLSPKRVVESLSEIAKDLEEHQQDALFKYLWAIERVRVRQPSQIMSELGLRDAVRREKRSSGQASPVVIHDILYRLATQFTTVDEMLLWIAEFGDDPDVVLDDQEPNRKEKGRVMLSTIHKAKGREWDHVGVLGPLGGMPDWRAETDDQKEEERRLAYVAATRAKKSLTFCASNQYAKELEPEKIYGPSRGGKPSKRIQPFGASVTCSACGSSFVTTGASCPFCSADL